MEKDKIKVLFVVALIITMFVLMGLTIKVMEYNRNCALAVELYRNMTGDAPTGNFNSVETFCRMWCLLE